MCISGGKVAVLQSPTGPRPRTTTSDPKPPPTGEPTNRAHNRVRTDKVNEGTLTLRHAGRLHHIGIGLALNRCPVLLLIHDLDITVIHATTGELIRQFTLNPDRDYQPQNSTKPPNP